MRFSPTARLGWWVCLSVSVASAGTRAEPGTAVLFSSAATEPVALSSPPGDAAHLVVCELPGVLAVFDRTTGVRRSLPLLDIRSLVSDLGDGGLLGFAFDPQFATNGYVYVFYNALPSPPDDRVLARYTVNASTLIADPNSAVTVWRYPRSVGHNGGWIGFSPIDGYLYLSSGDGGTAFTAPDIPNNAQTIVNNVQGKLLRIDPRSDAFPADPLRNYAIPATNPFVGVTGDDEIWAFGLRNPWRCAFDRANGDLFIADVGLDNWEEINIHLAGASGGQNYGWKCMEGNHCTGFDGGPSCVCFGSGMTAASFEYDHSLGHSITGGHIYRGSAITAWQGRYFFADFVSNRIWSIRHTAGIAHSLREHTTSFHFAPSGTNVIENVSSFGEDLAGELYMCDYYNGLIYKIVPNPCPADVNHSGSLTVQDIFDFLTAWFTGGVEGDFNDMGGVTVQGIFDFLTAWFAGCP